MSRVNQKVNQNRRKRFKSIDEFIIIEEIGKGGYSKVYLVEHKRTGRQYALKAAFRYKNGDRSGKDRSHRTLMEAKVLKRLRHRNVVRLKGHFEDDDTIYLVLEYLPGKDCSKFFKNGIPSKEEVKNIMRQLITAVMYCHSKGIVHRDIKLENLLIDDEMNVKLTDFGLCAIKEDQYEMLESTLGTVRYTAPEMLAGNGYNESVDVWAIGVILFMLLTGSYPIDGSEKSKIFRRIKEKTIHYSKYNLERTEVKLLRKLLEKDPDKRLEIGEILSDRFFQ